MDAGNKFSGKRIKGLCEAADGNAIRLAVSKNPVDPAELLNYNQWNDLIKNRKGLDGWGDCLEVHHVVPKKEIQKLLKRINPSKKGVSVDSSPAIVLPRTDHRIGPDAFHAKLRAQLAANPNPESVEEVAELLKDAYTDYGAPDLGEVAKKWVLDTYGQ